MQYRDGEREKGCLLDGDGVCGTLIGKSMLQLWGSRTYVDDEFYKTNCLQHNLEEWKGSSVIG